MAKVTMKHISLRGGRPRFEPAPKVRAFGFKGEDLKHADGTWFSTAFASQDAWVSEEEHRRAVETNSCWRVRGYQRTPVSFVYVLASSLEAALRKIAKQGAPVVIEG